MSDHTAQGARASDPTIVVDETSLVDATTIKDGQVREMLQEAQEGGDDELARICAAALQATGARRQLARGGCAEIWNARVALAVSGAQSGAQHSEDDDAGDRDLTTIATIPTSPNPTPPSFSLSFVPFACPLCHRMVVTEEAGGVLRVPWHRVPAPVFPFGYGGPLYRVECPASMMQITELCDRGHAAPPCDDPRCWQDDRVDGGAGARDQDRDAQRWDADEDTSEGRAYEDPRWRSCDDARGEVPQ